MWSPFFYFSWINHPRNYIVSIYWFSVSWDICEIVEKSLGAFLVHLLGYKNNPISLILNDLWGYKCGKGGIRTPGPSQVSGFQDRRNRPLCHLSCWYWRVCWFRFVSVESAKILLFFILTKKTFCCKGRRVTDVLLDGAGCADLCCFVKDCAKKGIIGEVWIFFCIFAHKIHCVFWVFNIIFVS